MLKKMLNFFKDEKGFSMIELIIVIAIIGIIGAVVAPNFTSTTRKAALKTDITSAKTIEKQIALYMTENQMLTVTGLTVQNDGAVLASSLPDTLVKGGYLTAPSFKPQTNGAKFIISNDGKVKVGVKGTEIETSAVSWAGNDSAIVDTTTTL